MPKAIGSPLTITVTNGQPQREVTRFIVMVTYDAAGVPHFAFQGMGTVRLRDASGAIVLDNITPESVIESLADSQLPGPVRTNFTAICAHLDSI